jgi:4-amino-4-deoxy-L-arabinose transferase-like glycosyltransferase
MGRLAIAFRQRRPLASVLIICTLAWLPGFFTLPPLDRDESRFAQATKQMLESRDFIDIRLGQGSRYEKPVGIYWLQAAATSALGGGQRSAIWTYRVPSLLGALAAVAATFWMMRGFARAGTAFSAALILGLSVLLMSEAKIAKTDAVLLATVTAAEAVLMRVYLWARLAAASPHADFASPEVRDRGISAPTLPLLLAGWCAVGLGILVKGPVIAIVCGATIVALVIADRDWRWLKNIRAGIGIPLALAIILPWAIAIAIASHGAFYEKSLGHDFALKLVGEQETHGAPPGYYTLLAGITFWPGTLLLIPALGYAWRRRTDPAVRFLLAWAAATWIVFELVPTKLPHYVLPAYPALAAICALGLCASTARANASGRVASLLSAFLFAVVGVALVAFLAIAPARLGGGTAWWVYAVALLPVTVIALALRAALLDKPRRAFGFASAAAILVYAIAGFVTAPRLTDLWLSPRMASAVARHITPSDPPVISAGYSEPSIEFLLGTNTALENGVAAANAAMKAGGLVLVSDDQRQGFLSTLEAARARAEPLEQIDGLNYSRGRKTRITLYRVVPATS